MANGKRNKITHAGKATRENRMVLFMLFQIFHFSDSEDEGVRQQLAAIFIVLYDDFKEYNYYNLYDRNVQRLKAGHQNADWKAIDRPNEWNNTTWNANELAHFATLRNNILREAARLGIQIAYKANPARKHEPLIPGHVPAPSAIATATNAQTSVPLQSQASQSTALHSAAINTTTAHSQTSLATGRSTHAGSSSTDIRNGNEEEDSENESDQSGPEHGSSGYNDDDEQLDGMNYANCAGDDDGNVDEEDNITWSDDIGPEANLDHNTVVDAHRSRFMKSRYDSEDEDEEDLPSEDESDDEDITWSSKNISYGKFSPEELQQHAIALMNAAREAENPEETIHGREVGNYLTPSWVVTDGVVHEEMKKLQEAEKLEVGQNSGSQETRHSLFSEDLAILTAEVGETDIEKMLAFFAETGKA